MLRQDDGSRRMGNVKERKEQKTCTVEKEHTPTQKKTPRQYTQRRQRKGRDKMIWVR